MNLDFLLKNARARAIDSSGTPATRAIADILGMVLEHLIDQGADKAEDAEHAGTDRFTATRDLEIDPNGFRVRVLGPTQIVSSGPIRMVAGSGGSMPADIAKPAATRRGPPPGVTDPTTLALEALTKERDQARKNLEQSELNARQAVEHLTERLNEQVRQREQASKRAQLADAEWNAARVALNPLIAPEFSGQSLADAVTHTIQLLEAKLQHATEAGQRAHDDAQRIQKLLAEKAEDPNEMHRKRRLDKLQIQRVGNLGTMADQARQIHELRKELATARSNHAAELHRQAANWDADRKEGAEQVARLSSENALQRAELHKLRSEAMTGKADNSRLSVLRDNAERSCTSFRERVLQLEEQLAATHRLSRRIGEQATELRDRVLVIADESFGPFPVLTTEQALTAIEQGIARNRQQRQRRDRLVEMVQAWAATRTEHSRTDGSLSGNLLSTWDWFAEADATAQAVSEAEQLAFLRAAGSPPENDCQSGTCDCPSRPGTYDIAHRAPAEPTPSADPPIDF